MRISSFATGNVLFFFARRRPVAGNCLWNNINILMTLYHIFIIACVMQIPVVSGRLRASIKLFFQREMITLNVCVCVIENEFGIWMRLSFSYHSSNYTEYRLCPWRIRLNEKKQTENKLSWQRPKKNFFFFFLTWRLSRCPQTRISTKVLHPKKNIMWNVHLAKWCRHQRRRRDHDQFLFFLRLNW